MTISTQDRERARREFNAFVEKYGRKPYTPEDFIEWLAGLLADAREEQREADAKICEAYCPNQNGAGMRYYSLSR